MTRDEALKLLRGGPEGIAEWNRQRAARRDIPSLARVHLSGACLTGADLGRADLRRSELVDAMLSEAVLLGADLRDAQLNGANVSFANLSGAKLTQADLSFADFSHTDLSCADLSGANLDLTDLRDSELRGANFHGAMLGRTVISCDLSTTIGLDHIVHSGPSIVDIQSILSFTQELPETFLRGCGLRDEEIAYFRSVVGKPIRFYSCFISYSTKDEEFASRLHNDFQAKGIRCWKWDHDARTGRSIWGEIDQAIRVHDKVVLIASESSLQSPGVNREIERAIQEEDRRMKDKQVGKFNGDLDVLFPVRVDDYILGAWQHERKADVVKKVIADARGWEKDPKLYARVRDKLIKDLKPA